MSERYIFHLSIPVADLAPAKRFYVEVLGATIGRENEEWLDVLLWGHQITLQKQPQDVLPPQRQGKRHFGVSLPWAEWENQVARIRASGTAFLGEPKVLLAGSAQEQAKFYLQDPSHNVIEVKAYRDTGGTIGVGDAGYADAKMPRFPALTRELMNEAQQRVYDAIAGGPRGGVRGPFGPLLRSPDLADRVQKLGEYLRFESSLPARLNEMAILINARLWGSKYEWFAHKPLAIKGGLAEHVADDLVRKRRPAAMQPDEEVIYDFCSALHETHFVDDALFKRALDLFGERGVVDLVAVSGYYTLVSMVLNVADAPLPPGVQSPW